MKSYIGCSGYHYDSWKGKFYDKELSKKDWLAFYAEHFNSLEVNNSFYQLPGKKTIRNWYNQTPDHFIFSLKGSRFISHQKKLKWDKDLEEALKKFYDTAGLLKDKLGCILWQLPGNLNFNGEKLDKFCKECDPAFKNIIEFRNQTWFKKETYEILKNNNTGYCILSAPDELPEDIHFTSDFGYIRFHGKKEWYKYDYSREELSTWMDSINKSGQKPKEIYAYFNNDIAANSVKNAMMFADMFNA